MSIGTSLHTLATHLESLGEDDVGVESVSVETSGETLTTKMTVAFPFDLAEAAENVTVEGGSYDDGTIVVDVSMIVDAADLPAVESTVQTTESDDTEADDGRSSDSADTGVPAYKDPDRLREVYDEYGSFAAMTDALGVDVTAQTVRRNMMKHGIHTPNTGDEGNDNTADETDDQLSDEQSVEAATDGAFDLSNVDLPAGVTPDSIRDAVLESSSLHGAQLALDLDIRETRALLQDLGVLEYVTGRLADRDDDPDPTEIEQQIYDSLAAHADGGRIGR